jgi:hypothetical protein
MLATIRFRIFVFPIFTHSYKKTKNKKKNNFSCFLNVRETWSLTSWEEHKKPKSKLLRTTWQE